MGLGVARGEEPPTVKDKIWNMGKEMCEGRETNPICKRFGYCNDDGMPPFCVGKKTTTAAPEVAKEEDTDTKLSKDRKIQCTTVKDCPSDQHCGNDGFCEAGLPCSSVKDCSGEQFCGS